VAAQEGHLENDEIEPPVSPGLGALSAPLRSLADFLRIDPDLIVAVSVLQDLRDLANMGGQGCAFSSRMEKLRRHHARKPTLLDRFRNASLMG
jgi:hypothetical protein